MDIVALRTVVDAHPEGLAAIISVARRSQASLAADDRPCEVCYLRAMMKIDAEKFLAMTVLLAATASAPGCGKKDTKTEAKTEAKAVPAAPVAPAPTTPAAGPGPVAQPPAVTPEVVAPPADGAGAGAGAGGGAAAKPDPGPEEEKPSW